MSGKRKHPRVDLDDPTVRQAARLFRSMGLDLRFALADITTPVEPTQTVAAPLVTERHSGSFEANGSSYYDDKAVDLRFGFGGTA